MYSEDSKKKIYYLLADGVALVISYLILSGFYSYHFFDSKFFAVIFGLLIIIVGVMSDEYSAVSERGYLQELKAAITYGAKVLVLFSFVLILGKFRFIYDVSQMSYFFLLQIFILTSLFVFLGRILIKALFKNRVEDTKNVLLVTDFSTGDNLEKELNRFNYKVTAYISSYDNQAVEQPVLKNAKEIRNFVANHQVDEIFVTTGNQKDHAEIAHCLKLLGIPTTVAIGNYSEFYVGDNVLKKLGNQTFVTTAVNIVKFRQLVLKRLMDIVISLFGILATAIIAIIIAPIVKKQSPGPLIFKQKRVGRNGKVFEIYKFRSMYMDAEERKKDLLAKNDLDTDLMFKMEDDPRIFPFGHKLRDWSLDEFPQFLNVLKGEMSFVGTRPPTLDEYHHYELHHFKRLMTKPGITGLWQVSGRSDITDFEEVVALDMKYIQEWNIREDLKIIAKTFAVVLKREGSR
ncbi:MULTISPECIES: sugar transferase [Streptococcus]|uniref:sugar transferase n=1 Tax=Streptococcus TaxID=1301 RepID=UPI00088A8C57|nr:MULTISPECIES: sugar transferase [Streptococcus]SDJ67114.1 exopolysaccharide biosynthesis polyprenyl glycosylphosphotransferase [Streptococcus gallolyticus]SDL16785.1 exopolysaccharide biosynthesis polyprenyl glycosylphosphotransferase [Streptococcus gallolyticus]